MTATTLLAPVLLIGLEAGVWLGATVAALAGAALLVLGWRSLRRSDDEGGDRAPRLQLDAGPANSDRSDRAGLCCPRCRRSFAAGHRYCPFDAEELVAPSPWSVGHEHGAPDGTVAGKICPLCAAKYNLEATFCGRDGSELVSVN